MHEDFSRKTLTGWKHVAFGVPSYLRAMKSMAERREKEKESMASEHARRLDMEYLSGSKSPAPVAFEREHWVHATKEELRPVEINGHQHYATGLFYGIVESCGTVSVLVELESGELKAYDMKLFKVSFTDRKRT